MEYIVEKTALIEFSQKYDLDINIKSNQVTELLQGMYHISFEAIKENVKDEYKNTFLSISEDKWKFLIKDLDALLSQLTKHNYLILLNDISKV
jgi:hypothetical protein